MRECNADAPIGVFDSGIGGLTVAREIMSQLPEEKIIYFGDTARLPYGNKSRETIIGYAKQIRRFLESRNVKAIVVACNTASAYALDTLCEDSEIPVVGMIHAGSKVATQVTVNGNIGVIGTSGTTSSGVYKKMMDSLKPGLNVIQKACPLFVPLVEEGLWNSKITDEVARMYLDELKEAQVDTMVLGCTHYPLLKETIARVMGDNVRLVNPAYETARELKEILREEGLLRVNGGRSTGHEFYASDLADKMQEFAGSILTGESINTSKIDITEY
ncbi:MAG: glutamate racemase [Lachnospiraceae bacterium]|nr:glutamate racemase [Lachnospiraceae bacterium]